MTPTAWRRATSLRINIVGAFIRNKPFGTEIAFGKGFDRLGKHLINTIDTSYPGQVWDYDADAGYPEAIDWARQKGLRFSRSVLPPSGLVGFYGRWWSRSQRSARRVQPVKAQVRSRARM